MERGVLRLRKMWDDKAGVCIGSTHIPILENTITSIYILSASEDFSVCAERTALTLSSFSASRNLLHETDSSLQCRRSYGGDAIEPAALEGTNTGQAYASFSGMLALFHSLSACGRTALLPTNASTLSIYLNVPEKSNSTYI